MIADASSTILMMVHGGHGATFPIVGCQKMKHQGLFLYLIFYGLTGCTLIPPPDVSVSCPNAEYYMNDNGNIEGYFTDTSDQYYQLYSETHYCPIDYPICFEANNNQSFCRKSCRNNEAFCGKCINTQEDDQYCGARGDCTDSDPESKNYKGMECDKFQRCINGICTCARDNDILCNNTCIDPETSDQYCGAKGLCTDTDPDSKNYQGMECTGGRKCDGGKCVCVKNWEVFCENSCIDPANSKEHCGAKGLCNNPNSESEDFVGGNCHSDEGGKCTNGQCNNCPENEHLYNNSCEKDDLSNCGGHGDNFDCNRIENVNSITCEQSHCVITECKKGYFLSADEDKCISCSDLVSGVSVGDSIYFGHYRQFDKDENKYPIKWQVLDENEHGILLLSQYILDVVKYNEKNTLVTWKTSTMRSWLNGFDSSNNLNENDYTKTGFIISAFNTEELKCIKEVENTTPDNQGTAAETDNVTKDKIFLLSSCELGYTPSNDEAPCPVNGYDCFKSNNDRKAYATEYAHNSGVGMGTTDCIKILSSDYQYSNENDSLYYCIAPWWLRSQGIKSPNTTLFLYDTVYYNGGQEHSLASSSYNGVRPALWLKK